MMTGHSGSNLPLALAACAAFLSITSAGPSHAAGIDILGQYFKGWSFGREAHAETMPSIEGDKLPYGCSYIYVVRGEGRVRQKVCENGR